MKIIKAKSLGMCFGVRDAIALARARAAAGPVTVLGDLVHNDTVLDELRARGVRLETKLEQVSTPNVLITAHGASQRAIKQARRGGFAVEEATCPLVHYAHRAMAQLVAEGFYPVIIGQRNHIEVRGVTEDLAAHSVLLTPEDVALLPEQSRYGVIAQTTQPLARAEALVALIRERFPAAEVRFVDTICRPTKQRQQAAHELARQAHVVVVIGGAHSNNTRELVAACERDGARVHHVQTAEDLRSEWFQLEDTVGITAGTSTPDDIIDAVEARLRLWAEEAAVTWTASEQATDLAVH